MLNRDYDQKWAFLQSKTGGDDLSLAFGSKTHCSASMALNCLLLCNVVICVQITTTGLELMKDKNGFSASILSYA